MVGQIKALIAELSHRLVLHIQAQQACVTHTSSAGLCYTYNNSDIHQQISITMNCRVASLATNDTSSAGLCYTYNNSDIHQQISITMNCRVASLATNALSQAVF